MNCAIYIRVSSQEQVKEGHSIPAQRRILSEYAESQNWNYNIYADEGISGETILRRPGIQELLAEVEARKFQVVLVIEFERLSRNDTDYMYIKNILRENGVKLATPNQILDLDEPDHNLQVNIRASISAFEKANMIKRMKRGTVEAAKKGIYIGSHNLLGYRFNKETKTLQLVPEEAEIIKTIFRLHIEGMGSTSIARYLTSRSIPQVSEFVKKRNPHSNFQLPKSSDWRASTVYRILSNPIYTGTYTFHPDRKLVKEGREEAIRQEVPAIISKEDFGIVQEKMKTQTKWNRRNNVKNRYLLKGILYCYCGSRMSGITCSAYQKFDKKGIPERDKRGFLKKRWKTASYYRCFKKKNKCESKWAPLEKIETLIWNWVVAVVKNPQQLLDAEIKTHTAENQKKQRVLPEELSVKQDKLRRVKESYDRLLDAYSLGYIEKEALKTQSNKMRQERFNLESEVGSIKEALGDTETERKRLEGITSYLKDAKESINAFDWERKRDFIKRLIYGVHANLDGGLEIRGILDSEELQQQLHLARRRKRSLCDSRPARFHYSSWNESSHPKWG